MRYESCVNYGFKPIEDRILNGAWNSYSEWCLQKSQKNKKMTILLQNLHFAFNFYFMNFIWIFRETVLIFDQRYNLIRRFEKGPDLFFRYENGLESNNANEASLTKLFWGLLKFIQKSQSVF